MVIIMRKSNLKEGVINMRMSSFIVGGVLGMVSAMYVMQRKPMAMQAVNQAMSDLKSNVINKAVNTMTSHISKSNGNSAQQSNHQAKADGAASQNHSQSYGNHHENEELIKSIIESDPALQSQVDEITKQPSNVKH